MSRIDDLIKKHAPNGVLYKSLGDVFPIPLSGYWGNAADSAEETALAVRNGDITSDGRVNWGALPLRGYSRKEANKAALRAGDILLTSSGHCGKVAHLVRVPNAPTVATNFVKILRPVEGVDSRFAYHFLRSSDFTTALPRFVRGAAMTNLDLPGIFAAVSIPVPPLEVQREIVRILDTFTALEAELEAELEARRQQYEHYRGSLLGLSFAGAPLVALDDLGRIVTGRTPKSADVSAWGEAIDFITPSDIRNGMKFISEPMRRLSESGANGMPKAIIPARSILVTCIGADMGKTVINARRCVTNQQINAIIPGAAIDIDYVFHVLTAMRDRIRTQGERAGGTLPIINKSDFSKIKIPVPSLETQRLTALQLDKFDALVNDLSVGLPAELLARRKQYEFYRDRLLSFQEASS